MAQAVSSMTDQGLRNSRSLAQHALQRKVKWRNILRISNCFGEEKWHVMIVFFLFFIFLPNWLSIVTANPVTVRPLSNANTESRDEALNEYFHDILIGLRAVMRTGSPLIKLPVLDPLDLGTKSLNYRTDKTRLDANFNNVSVKGLANFTVIDMNVDVPKLQVLLHMYFPEVVVDGLYDLSGVAMHVLPLRGRGPWHVHLFNFTATGLIKLQFNSRNEIRVRMISIVGDVHDSRIQFQNLIDKGDLGRVINRILQTNSRRLLNEGLKELRGALEHAVAPYTTDVLDSEFILEMSATTSSITQTS